ncbi:MAG: hypothetical protein HQ582_29040, partial [Planctomycetes bacterium]|nr:hypothetical protein [Planctomycetota bacterium]
AASTGIRKILFLGNSITLHGPAPAIGWLGNWGMAASAQEKDFVHIVTSSLSATTGTAPEVMVKNIAQFERQFATYNVDEELKDAFAFRADLVVVAIGENVPTLDSEEANAQFGDSMRKLLRGLRADDRSTIIVRSCFSPNQAKDQILEQACREVDGIFVDIGNLSKDESNYARSEREFAHGGVAAHPGDRGMRAIADAILDAVRSGRGKDTVAYRCLFNHELLIVCHKKDNSREYITSFIEKLEDTDVDAVMCCPTAWRANVYPSEIDPQWKKYTPEQVSPKFRSFDYIMKYIHSGGDPVKETLDACRNCGKDFFISYRMNDHHYITDVAWPTHNFFWREHPEYWLGDTDTSPYARGKDNARLLNYMIPEVRDHYYSILEELCTNYDVDGVELDFQRFPRFFHNDKLEEGTRVMTAFVQRIGKMLDRIGRERGKSPKLCVRVPQTVKKCEEAGLDVIGWDVRGLVDMINVSSFYIHTMELGIEEFQAKTRRAKIYGEMNYVTYQNSKVSTFARRYTTIAAYRASALNLLHRGADGLSLFNYDYVPSNKRLAMAPGLEGITDVAFLETVPKHYVVSRGFGSLPATNEATINLVVPDDTAKVTFERSVLRVETEKPCADLEIAVRLNGEPLEPCEHDGTELFPPLADNAGYAEPETLKFYAVPLDLLVPGGNKVEMTNLNEAATSCRFVSLELGLFLPEP